MTKAVKLIEVKDDPRLKKILLQLIKKRGSNFDSDEGIWERIARYSVDPLHLLMVASMGGTPVGYIWCQNYRQHLRDGKCLARLHDIFTLPEQRGKGIGTEDRSATH